MVLSTRRICSAAWRNFASGCFNVVVYVFVSNYEWRESETRFSVPLLGGISRALAFSTLWSMFLFRPRRDSNFRCLEEFRERLLHHTLWSMFLFRIMNGGSLSALFSMYVCVFTHWTEISRALAHRFRAAAAWCCSLGVFTHWTPNNPELSAAWRNFASGCSRTEHVVVYVFVSNYEWRESEALSFNVCLRVHTLDTKQP
ncbi:hypothetical protein TcBrA4_0018230 [Trypanosoma cruzi]|nr:hypothetical protein TcBrA4_0018230 [Trypanosoma cruzi]